jgi:hypothetical protein
VGICSVSLDEPTRHCRVVLQFAQRCQTPIVSPFGLPEVAGNLSPFAEKLESSSRWIRAARGTSTPWQRTNKPPHRWIRAARGIPNASPDVAGSSHPEKRQARYTLRGAR